MAAIKVGSNLEGPSYRRQVDATIIFSQFCLKKKLLNSLVWVKFYRRPFIYFSHQFSVHCCEVLQKRPPVVGIYLPGSRRASSPGLMLYWLGCLSRFSRWHPSVWTQHVWLDFCCPILKYVEVDHQSSINKPMVSNHQSSILGYPRFVTVPTVPILVKRCHKPHKPSIWTDCLYDRP